MRFEGIDAPGLHYGNDAQPLGKEERDVPLKWMGFTDIHYDNQARTRVSSAHPETMRGAILSRVGEANGRPVSYAFLESDAQGFTLGQGTHLDVNRLPRTLNVRLLAGGLAYPTLYTSTPYEHREFHRGVTRGVRQARQGLWTEDTTIDYVLETQADLAPCPMGN